MKTRLRRNRKSSQIREMVSETRLVAANLIYPLFLVDGHGIKAPIDSLPMASRMSIDHILKEIEECRALGLNQFILFPSVDEIHKDKEASYSWNKDNFYLRAAQRIKKEFPDAVLISDVAMDPYSTDGHDGYVNNEGRIDNDRTLPILAKMAIAQAEAGFDILGPSDMMDGRIGYLRDQLDEAGFVDTSIMSYAVKYASGFYGPFRDALESAPKSGDKKTYQMDPANKREAVLEAYLDAEEGADFLMVKPAVHYLDVIHTLKEQFHQPIAAYHVSGECAMLYAACANNWLDYETVMPETLLGIKRAGADLIITYFAKDMAKRLL